MLGLALAMLVRFAAIGAEVECRDNPVDYDVSECDGMAVHLMSVPHIHWISKLPPSEECEQY